MASRGGERVFLIRAGRRRTLDEHAFDKTGGRMTEELTERQHRVLQFVAETVADRGYPPSVREICDALGLASPSTAHSHLQALQRKGYIRIDPTKPRAIEVLFDQETGLPFERRPARSIPHLGRIAAG